jgi:Spy/CpxP family protein refolding chaperone
MGPNSINTFDTSTPGSGLSNITTTASWLHAPTLEVNQSGTIELRGKNADIRVNGESLMETLKGIQGRLNMLRHNTELEAEWDQLRELGDQYRKLEAEFKEKSTMWNTLKK